MKVRFGQDVLNRADAWKHLDDIIHFFEERRHLWDIDDIDAVHNSPWIQSNPTGRAEKRNLETAEKCFTDSFYPRNSKLHTLCILVTMDGDSNLKLSPEQARRCLETPAAVLVENAASDGAFLIAMIEAFDRMDLFESLEAGWWHIEQLGGFGEVGKRIDQISNQTIGPLRVFVLADSDRLFPGQVTDTVRKVTKECEERGVAYLILHKRKIENYIPVEALETLKGEKYSGKILAYAALNAEQRSHYDLKKGFKKSGAMPVEIKTEQCDLYADCTEEQLEHLAGGFGDNVWTHFRDSLSEITAKAVTKICGGNASEIEILLDNIESII